MPSDRNPLEALVDPIQKDSGDNTKKDDDKEKEKEKAVKPDAEANVAKAKKELKDEAELVSLLLSLCRGGRGEVG
jgi:hypothetical protein